MQEFPLISIITLNYNQPELTYDFLESCRQIQYPHFEIIVCDMHSNKPPIGIKDRFPHTKLILSDKNLGFAGGNNLGMEAASGEYFFLVNNDTILTPDILNVLLECYQQNPAAGIVCPKIKYYNNPHLIQYAGFHPMNFKTGRTTSIGYQTPDNGQYDKVYATAAAHGCAMLISKNVYKNTGGFDERFFLYYEEWDWSERIKRAGYKIYFCGNTYLLHKDSATVGKRSSTKEYYLNRNRIFFIKKHASVKEWGYFKTYYHLIVLPSKILGYILKGEFKMLKIYLKALKDSKRMLS